MAGYFNRVQISSNAILLRLEADDKFIDYLTSTVKKSFSNAIIMRQSIFIFSRENETHRRKVFLTWAANLLSKDLSVKKSFYEDILRRACELPITIQIANNSSLIGIKKAYAYFDSNSITLKCYGKEAPLFSYIKASLRGFCDTGESLYELKLTSLSKQAALYIKDIFSKRLLIGLESYEVVYSKIELESFLNRIDNSSFSFVDTLSAKKAIMLSILGLAASNLTPENLKKRYFELAKKYHPDLHQDKSLLEKEAMSKKFMQIKEAYEHLKAS